MKFRISHALAMRSTLLPLRVTQVAPDTGDTLSAFAFTSLCGSIFSSSSRTRPSAASRPLAAKKSIDTTSDRRLRSRPTFAPSDSVASALSRCASRVIAA
jgi:hypothetical protein